MPSRWTSVAIMIFWIVMMTVLLQRDLLPRWTSTSLPSYETAVPKEVPAPVSWTILRNGVPVGQVRTEWETTRGSRMDFVSELSVAELPDFFRLLGVKGGLRCNSAFHVTSQGQLEGFEIRAFVGESLMQVNGKLDGELLHVTFRTGAFTHEETFFHEPQSLVTSTLTPLDKLPNLAVGKKWQYRVMTLFQKSSEVVQCEVLGQEVITWKNEPVICYVVAQRYHRQRARCWVAMDGTVLRQEVPILNEMLVLEHE